MALPERVKDILVSVGQVAAEVPASRQDLRAFVTVFRFQPSDGSGTRERYAYLGPLDWLYRARRFQVRRELLANESDVHEEDLWDSQNVVLPDDHSLEFILRLWLPDLACLVEPRLTEVPI